MKIRYFPLLSLLLFLSLSFMIHRSFADASDRAWQTSVEPVTLSLRNKLLNDAYTVEFIVQASASREVTKDSTEVHDSVHASLEGSLLGGTSDALSELLCSFDVGGVLRCVIQLFRCPISLGSGYILLIKRLPS